MSTKGFTVENIDSINAQLKNLYGIDTVTGWVMWRVVWSNDQTEKVFGRFEDFVGKIFVREVTEVRERLKYAMDPDRWILEQLVLVPEVNQEEMLGLKISYEPKWTFEDKKREYLPPALWACRYIIDAVLEAQGQGTLGKWYAKDDRKDGANGLIARKKRVDKIYEELFSNETDTMDNVSSGQGVVISNTDALIKE